MKASADYAFQRRAGSGVEFSWHTSSQIGIASGEYAMLHGFGHEDGILSSGDSCIHQDGVSAEFHGDGGVRGGTDAGVENQRNAGDDLAQDANVGGILNSQATADGGAERHDGGSSGIEQALGKDHIVGGVGENGESFLHQHAGGFKRGLNIGVESRLVSDYFQFYPIGKADFPA